MRKMFPGYYRPTKEEFFKMWEEATFAFDTNILLNTYRYTAETQKKIFEILEQLKDRIWLPYQVAFEYHERRLDVISEQVKVYEDIETLLDRSLQQLESLRHLYIDIGQIAQLLREAIDKCTTILYETASQQPDFFSSDNILEIITDLFNDRVGKPYSDDEKTKLYKEAEQRINQHIPPGYKDSSKGGLRPFGDVILWFQLIDYAKSTRRPIIFVTDDDKEDWWLKHKGRTIGPRPELGQEMFHKAEVPFYMYQTQQFLGYAEEFLGLPHQPEVIQEVGDVLEEWLARDPLGKMTGGMYRTLIERGVPEEPLAKAVFGESVVNHMLERTALETNAMFINDLASTSRVLDAIQRTEDLRTASILDTTRRMAGLDTGAASFMDTARRMADLGAGPASILNTARRMADLGAGPASIDTLSGISTGMYPTAQLDKDLAGANSMQDESDSTGTVNNDIDNNDENAKPLPSQ